MGIVKEKQELREKIWGLLERNKIAKFCKGKIPNFKGKKRAAEKLKEIEEWKKAKIVFANPDAAQKPVRELALKQGKMLIMATPRLKKGYLLIKPQAVKGKESYAATIRGAFKYGKSLKELIKPDIIVTGCVAVDKEFYRLGKGGGYGDIEISTFQNKFGKIPVITTIHDLQLVEKVPVSTNDTVVDIVVTPTKILRRKLEKI